MATLVLVEVLNRQYGLLASAVHSLERAVTILPLPGAPNAVEGLIDVHGRLIPVFDLRFRLSLPPKEVELSDHLVIAEAGGRLVALRVDRALELIERNIEDTVSLVPGLEHVAGVVRLPEGLALIHDLETFLSPAESLALEGALDAAKETP